MLTDEQDVKLAAADYDIHELIQKRWSPRAFSDEPVEPDLVRQLFDAARWAPSSYNEQPWRFIVTTKDHPDEYEQLAEVMNEKNRQWAMDAPVLVLTLIKEHFDLDKRPNKHAEHDLGQAVAFLTLEATRHDLYLHQMAGILPEKARRLYNIPDHFNPMTMIAVGYKGEPEQLSDTFRQMEHSARSRASIDEIMFRGSWDDREALK